MARRILRMAGIVVTAMAAYSHNSDGQSAGPPCAGSKFRRLRASGSDFVLEWYSETNATYEIVFTPSLTGASWHHLATGYPAASSTNLSSYTHVGAVTNPAGFYKVAKTGVTIMLCQSNTFSGLVDIPVEIGMPPAQELSGIYFLLDGEPTMSIANPYPPYHGIPTGVWDTTVVSNGWHSLQAFAEYPTGQNADGGYAEHASQVVQVQTLNPISFPEMPVTLGTSMPIRASITPSNANWMATVRSPSNELLRAFSGTATNGVIDVQWDGNDTNGVQFAGPFVQVEVTTSYESGGGFGPLTSGVTITNKAGKIIYKEGSMPSSPQGFLVSYQLLFTSGSLSAIQFENMIEQVALTVDGGGSGPYVLRGDGTGTSATTKIENTASSWNSWALSLEESSTANLFYFGHGAKNAVGERAGDPNKGFFVNEIQTLLHNEIVSGVSQFTAPYRFVFLDGCNTANGDWCIAFGIERKKVPTAEYTKRGLLPRAFMGWKTVKAYAIGGAFNNEHGNFVINFFTRWSSGQNLKTAIASSLPSAFSSPVVFGDDELQWNLP